MKIRDISGGLNLLALLSAGMVSMLYGLIYPGLGGGLFLIFLGMAQLCVAIKIWRKLRCTKT